MFAHLPLSLSASTPLASDSGEKGLVALPKLLSSLLWLLGASQEVPAVCPMAVGVLQAGRCQKNHFTPVE